MKITKILALTAALGGVRATNTGDAPGASPFTDTQKNVTMKRKIDTIIIHCSATKEGLNHTAADIDCWHREQGSEGIGYHYVICLNGKIEKGRDINQPGAHCRGWNARSIGICYIGGLDENGRPTDTRTKAQKKALYKLIETLRRDYPGIQVVIGHRDTSPDLNGNGRIEPQEYIKACPCFDVKKWLGQGREKLLLLLGVLIIMLWLSACRSGRKMQTSHIITDSVVGLTYGKREETQQSLESIRMEQTEECTEEMIYLPKQPSGQPLSRIVTKRKTYQTTQMKNETGKISTDSTQTEKHTVGKEIATVHGRNEKTGRNSWKGWLAIVLIIAGGGYIWKRKSSR